MTKHGARNRSKRVLWCLFQLPQNGCFTHPPRIDPKCSMGGRSCRYKQQQQLRKQQGASPPVRPSLAQLHRWVHADSRVPTSGSTMGKRLQSAWGRSSTLLCLPERTLAHAVTASNS